MIQLVERMCPLFTQERVAASAGAFLDGLLGNEQRKTGRRRRTILACGASRPSQSELYALFVGDLAARINGRGGFKTPWSDITLISTSEIEELQMQLKMKGVYKGNIDGFAGSRTRAAIGSYQKSNALKADCWPTKETVLHIKESQR